jgi:hypothetical protein
LRWEKETWLPHLATGKNVRADNFISNCDLWTIRLTFIWRFVKVRPKKTFGLARCQQTTMKSKTSFELKHVAVIAISAFLTFAANTQAADRSVSVDAIEGTAQYSTGGGPFMALPGGAKLKAGDVIRTGSGSRVSLNLGSGVGTAVIGPTSTVAVDKVTALDTGAEKVTETQLDLRAGKLYGKVNKLAKASRFEVKTPRGIAGIRGTTFSITDTGCLTVGEGTCRNRRIRPMAACALNVVNANSAVCPDDAAPHPAAPDELQAIIDALKWFIAQPGIQQPLLGTETFVSPTTGAKAPGAGGGGD